MKVHKGFDGIQVRNAVVTTGSFDGVHVGHKTIINRLKDRARELNGESVLITFYPHPRKVLYPDSAGKDLLMITTYDEKISELEKLGLDHLIVVNFTLEFSKTSSIDFIRKILVSKLHVRHVIIGFNHHFGHNREGDLEYLEELGSFYKFTVEEIPEQDIQNESVSSTKIRKALTEGNIQRANAYLDHSYVLSASMECGSGKNLDFPFVLSDIDPDKLVPPPGAYAGSVSIKGKRYKVCLWHLHAEGETRLFAGGQNLPPFDATQSLVFTLHKRINHLRELNDYKPDGVQKDLAQVEDLIY